jgi:hypothetical protein
MFTKEEQLTIKALALGYLESNYAGEDDLRNLDLAMLPLSNFEADEDSGGMRRLQNCQAIIKRLNTGLYTQTQLQFKESGEAPDKPEQANLGLATTGELLEEVKARVEIDGKLNYRTVGHE